MKNLKLMLWALCLLLSSKLIGDEFRNNNIISEETLNHCEKSIRCAMDKKIYINPENVFFFDNHFFLLNDFQQLMPVGTVLQDLKGLFLYAQKEPRCPNGHAGFMWVKPIWYCLEEDCPYFIDRR